MTITGIISAILIGVVVGVLGRLLVPGKQPIGMLLTILVGIVAAFLGTALARNGNPDGDQRSGLAGTVGSGRRRSTRCGVGVHADRAASGRPPRRHPASLIQRLRRMIARSLSRRPAISRSAPWLVGL